MTRYRFELFVAARYLRAHRGASVISVITAISVLGVAVGVMSLIIAIAVTTGFRNTLERNLLGAMAHINVSEKLNNGIDKWRDLSARLRSTPHVTAVSPALYTPVFLSGAVQSHGAVLKGVEVDSELSISDALRHLKSGSTARLRDPNASPPGIVLGARLAEDTGMRVNDNITLVSPEGELTPSARARPSAVSRSAAFTKPASSISTTCGPSPPSPPRRRPYRSRTSSTRSS